MRKLQIKESDIIRFAVQDEIMRSEESRYDHRLHGVLMVCSGFSCYEVADIFGHSPRTVQYWVRRFEQSGFSGLQETFRPGRPSALSQAVLEAIGQDLRQPPLQFDYGQNLWDGKLLSHHLSEQYGLNLGIRQCQRLFHKLEFRRRKPRPLIAKADQEAQRIYKKTSPFGKKKKL